MPTPPPIIPSYPTPVPSSADPASFDSRADAFHAAAPTVVDGENATAANVYANALEAEAFALAAQAASDTAQLTADADIHNPATDYVTGQNAISAINYQTYRRKAPGGVDAADPSSSSLWEGVGFSEYSQPWMNMVRNGDFNFGIQLVGGPYSSSANVHQTNMLGWRSGASGMTYSGAIVGGHCIITLTAGSMVQNISAMQIRHGRLYLTWVGTAQGRINGGAYGPSGVFADVASGNVSVEFTGGSVSRVQLSPSASMPFQARSTAQEEEMFSLYYWTSFNGPYPFLVGLGSLNGSTPQRRAGAETVTNFDIRFPRQMAIVPTMTWIAPVSGTVGSIRNVTANADVAVTGAGTFGPTQYSAGGVLHASNGAAGNVIAAHWIADARL